MNPHIEKAKVLRNEVPMVSNCAQTILKTYAEELGLSEEQASGLGVNFGGGMKCGSVCGVITAGLMVLGMKGLGDPATCNAFIKKMGEKHDGMIHCADLLKANIQRGGKKKPHCDDMVYSSIETIDAFLQEKGQS